MQGTSAYWPGNGVSTENASMDKTIRATPDHASAVEIRAELLSGLNASNDPNINSQARNGSREKSDAGAKCSAQILTPRETTKIVATIWIRLRWDAPRKIKNNNG